MKIAIIIVDISIRAGTERAVSNLANILVKKHQITIISICSKSKQEYEFQLSPQVSVFHLNKSLQGGFIKKSLQSWQTLRSLRQLFRQNDFDAIIGTKLILNLMLPFFSAKSKKIACEHFSFKQNATFLRLFLKKWLYTKLDALVLLTHHDAVHYTFIPEERRFVIPNSLSFFCDSPSDCEKKRIIALGRLTSQKGFDFLIKSAVKIKQAIPDWHIDIFGKGEDETELKQLARKLQVDDFISFYPPTTEVMQEMCNAGMYLMSSRHEGLPMVLIEAQECGLPIVSFDCPEGPSEIIHDGEDGFLVPLADTDALAEKVILLANDLKKRKLFGKNAKQNSQQFSPEKIEKTWLNLLNRIVKGNVNEI